MTLEEVIYWIVVIFFALPIALGALLYIWRSFASIFSAPRLQREEEERQQHLMVEGEESEQYWEESDKRQED